MRIVPPKPTLQKIELEPLEARRLFASLSLASPLPAHAAGNVQWEVSADASVLPSFIDLYIDGQKLTRGFNRRTFGVDLDTRHLLNGTHELLAVSYGASDARLAESRTTFITDNGRALSEVRSFFDTIYLRPGDNTNLQLQNIYCDGSTDSFTGTATFAIDRTTTSTITSSGRLTGVADGQAFVTISAGGFSHVARVIVDSTPGFSHFGKDGSMLEAYDPGNSLFMRTMFNLGVREIESTPGLAQQAHVAGINTLTSGFYSNPADSGAGSFAAWKSSFDQMWNRTVQTAATNQFSLLLIGDDLARTQGELSNSINNAWSADAIRYALDAVKRSGRVVSIEMVDEINQLWGNSPPTAFRQLMTIVNSAASRPEISWPVISNAANDAVQNWMGDASMSDYTSHYWDITQMTANTFGGSFGQIKVGMEHAAVGRYAHVQQDTPMLILTSASGDFYKNIGTPSATYNSNEDVLLAPGNIAGTVSLQIMDAAALGAAGVRTYAYDGPWQTERLNARAGQELQTGASPTAVGQDRWRAMSAAYNTIARVEPFLLQPQMNAVDLGDAFVTTARTSASGKLFMAVNNSNQPVTIDVNLSPYVFAAGRVNVYRVAGESTSLSEGASRAVDRVTFAAGEAIIWVETPAGLALAIPTPAIPTPTIPAPTIPTPTTPIPTVPTPTIPTPTNPTPTDPAPAVPTPTPQPTAPAPVLSPDAPATPSSPPTVAPMPTPVATPADHAAETVVEPVLNPAAVEPSSIPDDHQKPKIHFSTVRNKAKVFGQVHIAVAATDNIGVDHVNFIVNGKVVSVVRDPQAGSGFVWDTQGLKRGKNYRITAQAFDEAGNQRKRTIKLRVIGAEAFARAYSRLPSPPTWQLPERTSGDLGRIAA